MTGLGGAEREREREVWYMRKIIVSTGKILLCAYRAKLVPLPIPASHTCKHRTLRFGELRERNPLEREVKKCHKSLIYPVDLFPGE